jgi:hypothetical protein
VSIDQAEVQCHLNLIKSETIMLFRIINGDPAYLSEALKSVEYTWEILKQKGLQDINNLEQRVLSLLALAREPYPWHQREAEDIISDIDMFYGPEELDSVRGFLSLYKHQTKVSPGYIEEKRPLIQRAFEKVLGNQDPPAAINNQ